MAEQRPKPKYNCTQAELYSICNIIWQSYAENQPDFEAFKTIYTGQYGTDALQEVEDAKNLPDFQARNQQTESAYIRMVETSKKCLAAWRALRSYIKSSFPPSLQKPEIEAAGEGHYMKALNRNWSETELMLVSALNYISAHNTELTTGGMPANFPTDMDNLRSEFSGLNGKFRDSEQDEHEGTDTKVNANNDVYAKLMAMGEDGQLIYESDPAKRERFIFTRIKDLITSKSTGTGIPADVVELSFYVFNSDTETAINGARVTILDPPDGLPITETTNSEGQIVFKIEGFEPATAYQLSMEVSVDDFDTQTGSIDVEPGQSYSLEIPLTQQVVP